MTGVLRIVWLVCAASMFGSCATSSKPTAPAPAPAVRSSEPQTPAAAPALVPLPGKVSFLPGSGLTITAATQIVVQSADPQAVFVAEFLAGLLTTVGPVGPSVVQQAASFPPGSIVLSIDTARSKNPESYELKVAADGIKLSAPSPAGLFYGVQTLRQLLPTFLEHEAARPRPIVAPLVDIEDTPRFAWRGAMLDVARHFFSVGDVKRYINLLALHKLNRLHLHLSDDQGFRVEIKSWPNLTATGARLEVGGTVGGFYSQEDFKEIVAYAQARFIEVVPEIDMPGHTNAALASYPELNCDGVAPPLYTDIKVGFSSLCVDREITYRFVEDVVREISSLAPSEFFHIGGDEVKKLTPEQYERFIRRVNDIVRAQGKKVIGWDEIAAVALAPPAVVQHWRPGTGLKEVVNRGSRLIMSPANRAYLDMQYHVDSPLGLSWAGRIEVRDAYSWDPAAMMEGVKEESVLGVEAPLWSETLDTIRDIEGMAFPRLAAIAEVGWSPQGKRDWEDFRVRLGNQGPRWQALGLNFYRSPQVPWKY